MKGFPLEPWPPSDLDTLYLYITRYHRTLQLHNIRVEMYIRLMSMISSGYLVSINICEYANVLDLLFMYIVTATVYTYTRT